MAVKTLVVVESPTKARTIRKFLDKNYTVESCMGHVRDLPQSAKDIPEKFKKLPWSNLGVNVDSDFEPIYCVPKNKTKIVKDLKDKLKDADQLILATDEDREGESISWHLLELLKPQVPVKRMVFHEITKSAIKKALDDCREVDTNLVLAQEARRVLDRLVGYTISPLIWKKVAYGLSAGRVQSVAVRLISEKEHDRIRFKKSEYWGVLAKCEKSKIEFEAKLFSWKGQRVALGRDFDGLTGKLKEDKKGELVHLDEKSSKKLVGEIKSTPWLVKEVEEKPVIRKPSPPFITSTLQQDANRKLNLSSRETMSVAQKLYERGFITYMRTDSTNLSTQAIDAARSCIKKLYGKDYLPESPRLYTKNKSKGAQEAHEAIRPAGVEFVYPEDSGLSGVQLALYELIWKRTVACQMVNAQQKQVQVKFSVNESIFSSSGMTIEFPGFLKAYVEGSDDPDAALDNKEVRLPNLKVKDTVSCLSVLPTEHETKPPSRYTEAGLVQKMEKEGIGRPSTYASIIGTIQDRGYVRKEGNALVPTFTALVVSQLLSNYLPMYVDLNFTSGMEQSLDDIAQGELDQVSYLKSIYFGKQGLKEQVEKQEAAIKPEESREIHLEGLKGLSFRVGRYGAYVCRTENGEEFCASIPDSASPADMTMESANKLIDQKINGTDALGTDEETGEPIYVLNGRYGPYVQRGDATEENAKPKRMALPPNVEPESVDLKLAQFLVKLPLSLGDHPDTNKDIKVGIGRFGPYVVHDGDFRSIPKSESVFEMNLEKALELFSKPKKGRGRASALKELGPHPEAQDEMQVMNGKYGPYIKCGKVNVSLPEDMKPEDVTKEKAIELLADKISGTKKKAKKASKKSKAKVAKAPNAKPAKKTTDKKVAKKTKKTVAKKKVIRRSAKQEQE